MTPATRQRKAPALLAALLCLLTGCAAGKATVDAAPYVNVCFVGENGSGSAELRWDTDGLTRAVSAALGMDASQPPEAGSREAEQVQRLLDSFTLQVTPAEGLSNGDTVTVEGAVDTKLWRAAAGSRLELSFTPFTAVVSGLQDITAIDPFENVEVSWSGYAPELSPLVSLRATRSEPWMWISYSTDAGAALDIGDTVTVTVAADRDTLAQLGYRLTEEQRQYTVPLQVGRYLPGWDTLDADALQTLLGTVQTELDQLPGVLPDDLALPVTPETSLTPETAPCSDFAFDSAYFLIADSRPSDPPGWRNALVCVYCFNAAAPGDEAAVLYGGFALPDLALGADGALTYTQPLIHFSSAAADRQELIRFGSAYRVAAVSFDRAATPESAS